MPQDLPSLCYISSMTWAVTLHHQISKSLHSKVIKQLKTMKNLFLVLCLVLCINAYYSNAAMTCGTVDMKAAPCVAFAKGSVAQPSAACCSGLQEVARSVKSVYDKKTICKCLKDAVKNFAGVQDKLLSKIPDACKIKVGFPVSMNTNCEKIH